MLFQRYQFRILSAALLALAILIASGWSGARAFAERPEFNLRRTALEHGLILAPLFTPSLLMFVPDAGHHAD